MSAPRGNVRHLWAWPMLLAATSLAGLVSALAGDGVYDALSWLGLGLPLAVGAWHWLRR